MTWLLVLTKMEYGPYEIHKIKMKLAHSNWMSVKQPDKANLILQMLNWKSTTLHSDLFFGVKCQGTMHSKFIFVLISLSHQFQQKIRNYIQTSRWHFCVWIEFAISIRVFVWSMLIIGKDMSDLIKQILINIRISKINLLWRHIEVNYFIIILPLKKWFLSFWQKRRNNISWKNNWW